MLTPTALGVTEGETFETYTVELATEPSGAEVTVTVGGADRHRPDRGQRQPDVHGQHLEHRPDGSSACRPGRRRNSDDSATLTHTGSGGGYGSVTEDLPVTVTDNDTAGIVLFPIVLVELSTEPSGQVPGTLTVRAGQRSLTECSEAAAQPTRWS